MKLPKLPKPPNLPKTPNEKKLPNPPNKKKPINPPNKLLITINSYDISTQPLVLTITIKINLHSKLLHTYKLNPSVTKNIFISNYLIKSQI